MTNVLSFVLEQEYRPQITVQHCRAYHEAGHIACCAVYGIPVLSASIISSGGDDGHMWHGEHDHRSPELALEANCVLCLSGQAAEAAYLGVVIEGGDHRDLEQCMQYLWREFHDAPSHSRGSLVEAALKRYRVSADRLVGSDYARTCIPRVATALMKFGSLTGEQISQLF